MPLLVFATLALLLCSLVSAAPPSQHFTFIPENEQYEEVLIGAENENYIISATSDEIKTDSLGEAFAERHTFEEENSSKDILSHQKPLVNEETSGVTVKEAFFDKETPKEREESQSISGQAQSDTTVEQLASELSPSPNPAESKTVYKVPPMEREESEPTTGQTQSQSTAQQLASEQSLSPKSVDIDTVDEETSMERKDSEPTTGQTQSETTAQQLASEQSLSPRSAEPDSVGKETPMEREDPEPTTGQTQSETTAQLLVSEQSLSPSPAEPETLSVTVEVTSESATKTSTTPSTTVTTTKKPKPSKPKPPRATTLKPLAAESPVTPAVTARPTSVTVKPTTPTSSQRYPCRCADGTCSCCTGILLENFNVPLRSRACANVTYEPDEFAFNFKLAYNNIVLYNRRMSAKNPRPACIPINRYFGIKMCAKLSNVYMSGRNMHACLDFEGFFDDETAFKYSFNCFRVGAQGVAIVRPEDGGGLPPPPAEEEQTDEDYDDSARDIELYYSEFDYNSYNDSTRGWVGDVQVVPT